MCQTNGRPGNGDDLRTRVEVVLDDEELAAVEGWRQANLFATRADALRALVRLGLITEVARTYRTVMTGQDRSAPIRNAGAEEEDPSHSGV